MSEATLQVEGKITHLIYRAPADRSSLKVFRNYEDALKSAGFCTIYRCFDFDKADIKAESRPQIDQLGELLKKNPKLDVLIVGHTDGQGAFDYNLSLSQRRAQAIASALNGAQTAILSFALVLALTSSTVTPSAS
ncbi:OmpA family protein [Reyranella massiliensis]|uniref:OmpA family protein n=1 Tax=Reyranella massiliensis TaxID=445220 RepID=UPI0005C29CBC|nr:OmpA family protein [Reyranella massiliensis]